MTDPLRLPARYQRGIYVIDTKEAVMPKEAMFTLKLEAELREQFVAEAEATHRPASQIVREFMRDFVRQQRAAREHDAWFAPKWGKACMRPTTPRSSASRMKKSRRNGAGSAPGW